MIYRVSHDYRNYLIYSVHPTESMKKLAGDAGTFSFNRAMKSYSDIWVPLEIQFDACDGAKSAKLPDISENQGRLYLSEKAHGVLCKALAEFGEFLPVTYQGEGGYIFNPLVSAEQHNAVDEKLTVNDEHGNRANLCFLEEKLVGVAAFKTDVDALLGIYCSHVVKDLCEQNGLEGVSFEVDAGNSATQSQESLH